MTPKQHENIVAWVAALRSGQYTQTDNALRTTTSFCCLGVAIDLFDKDNWLHYGGADWWIYKRPTDTMATDSYPPSDYMMQNYGMDRSQFRKYAQMNDEGKLFTQIADQIEKDFLI